ncbi:uncharacterized protein LOC133348042 [Lethenteron reissneri]|uniref:uncharacterized protein LOC133348042 n=1 Tax=Lethenteron reissneri TaxID=7753 RepID=UPI002AB799F3|nr:uncharacterized protein LOC133348042 [Lethenteron reissneri]
MDPHEAIENAFKHALKIMLYELEPHLNSFHQYCNDSYKKMKDFLKSLLPVASSFIQGFRQEFEKNDKKHRNLISSSYNLLNEIHITHRLLSSIVEEVIKNKISVEEADAFLKTKIADIEQPLTQIIADHEHLLDAYKYTMDRVTEKRNSLIENKDSIASGAAKVVVAGAITGAVSTAVIGAAVSISPPLAAIFTLKRIATVGFGLGVLGEALVLKNNKMVLNEMDLAFKGFVKIMVKQTEDILTVQKGFDTINSSFKQLAKPQSTNEQIRKIEFGVGVKDQLKIIEKVSGDLKESLDKIRQRRDD